MVDIITDKNREAESVLLQGIELMREERLREAHLIFEKAYNIDPENPRTASYYGLTCALEHNWVQKGIDLCTKAARHGIPDPMLWLNLAKIYMKIGNRRNAVASMQRGLKVEKGNKDILAFWKKIGMRRPPPIKFLHRDNIVNKMMGRWTYKGRHAAISKKPKKSNRKKR